MVVYMGNNAYIHKRKDTVYNIIYIVSVKVQFFCFPIGQKRITCRFAKCRVYCSALATRQLVHNRTFIDRSTIEWVQGACASTVKFQSSFYYRWTIREAFFFWVSKLITIFLITFAIKKVLPCKSPELICNVAKSQLNFPQFLLQVLNFLLQVPNFLLCSAHCNWLTRIIHQWQRSEQNRKSGN
jgi:hypothetical protein